MNGSPQNGVYLNGDPWVVGPVTITNISPGSSVSGGRVINGSMLNPGLGADQGWDSGTTRGNYVASLNVGRPNGNNLSVSNPLTVSSGSLLSSVSMSGTNDRPFVKGVSVLTVVSSAPSANSFRPPYVGGDKTSYWNKNQIDWNVLPNLDAVASAPSISGMTNTFDRVWIEFNTGWTGDYFHPEDNMPNYGRDMSHEVGEACLLLMLNNTQAAKEPLLHRVLQYGIDIYGVAKAGGSWNADGGVNPGRKLPVLLAGKIFNHSQMLSYADKAVSFRFQEDQQTFFVSQVDVNINHKVFPGKNYPVTQYSSADIGMAEWGIRHYSDNHRQYDNKYWPTDYRRVAFPAMPGHALVARLINGVNDWNWPPFFAYCDRYMAVEPTGTGVNSVQPFVRNMWNAYRDGAPPPANRVIAPVITPDGESSSVDPISVSLSSATEGAEIYYTLDGSVPTTSSLSYTTTGPFVVSESATVQAIGVKADMENSVVSSLELQIGEFSSAENWENLDIDPPPGTYTVSFDVTPSASGIDAVTGLSEATATGFSALAVSVRFAPSGIIDVRNGGAYEADSELAYEGGTTYRVVIDVDLENHTYTVTVTPLGGVPTLIARDYDFRTEQSEVNSLNKLAYISFGGSHTISSVSYQSDLVATSSIQSVPLGSVGPKSVVGLQVKPVSGALLIGLSDGMPGSESDVACRIRFQNGLVEVFNGDSFAAQGDLGYEYGSEYRVVVYADSDAKKYTVQVIRPDDGVSLVALNYDFHSEFSAEGEITDLAFYSIGGSSEVSDVRVDLPSDRALFFPTPPAGKDLTSEGG
ncbi:chitobiase/beta-hexosaminidase C-terminal domain-containing protein [Haloferula sp.]|uniref:chitobiase/beta-hexosaminidase C-terminal domain-containing protein n=1 Tax=Haloferula sp. TaxID=2497595 RepID=UPI00329DD0E9